MASGVGTIVAMTAGTIAATGGRTVGTVGSDLPGQLTAAQKCIFAGDFVRSSVRVRSARPGQCRGPPRPTPTEWLLWPEPPKGVLGMGVFITVWMSRLAAAVLLKLGTVVGWIVARAALAGWLITVAAAAAEQHRPVHTVTGDHQPVAGRHAA